MNQWRTSLGIPPNSAFVDGTLLQTIYGRAPVPVSPPQRHLQGVEHQLGPLCVAADQPTAAREHTSTTNT